MKSIRIRNILLLLICSLNISVSLYAQAKQANDSALIYVKVTIVDSFRQPLAGATVQISTKKQSLMADEQGEVSFWVEKNAFVEFKYIGMKTLSMQITKPLSGHITLEEESQELDQVVVTGYQRTTKRRTTGSLATLTAKDIKGSPTTNLDMLMQGKMAGVDIKSVSGRPGQAAKIRIRGTNTITGNADPLWVIDGVILQRDIPKISTSQVRAQDFNDILANGISGINPNDIESITVLKDASAAAIYGSRAAGGVIVVTTKRGKEGKMQVNYSTNVSMITSPPRNANLMNSKEKLAWEQELWNEFSASGFAQKKHYPVVGVVGMIRSGYGNYAGMNAAEQDAAIASLANYNTDWFSELFRNSISQSHYLSLSGGASHALYYLSLGYSQNNGLLKKNDYDRYNVSAKLDLKPHNRIKLNFTADMSMQQSLSPSLNVDPFKYAYFANPYERVYNDDGSLAADKTYFNLTHINGSYDIKLPKEGFNILREINESSVEAKNLSASLIAGLNLRITNSFNLEGLASFGYTTDTSDNINGKNTYAAWMDRPFEASETNSDRRYGSITQSSSYNTNYNLRGQFHYFNTFADKHYVSALLGSEIRGQYSKSIFEKRYGYDPVSGNSSMPIYPPRDKWEYADLISYASIMDNLSGQSILENAFASFYFSLDYVLLKRYILSLTARSDGSNSFGSKEQFNPTGSAGFSWNIDQESFMQALKPLISSLSFRAALGYTGNINKSVFPQLVMDYSKGFRKTHDDYYRIGSIKNAPNKHLRWEKTQDMKVSIDIGFLNDRLRMQAELYNRHTYDAVTGVPTPYSTGFSQQSYNTSELLNQGAELSLGATLIKTRDWRLNLTSNIAYNRNRLLKYDANASSWNSPYYVGYPLNRIVGGKVEGIDRRLGIYTYKPRPDAKFETAADRGLAENYAYYLGTSNAPVNGGYSLSLSYKNWYAGLGGSFSLGGKILNKILSPVTYTKLEKKVIEQIPQHTNDLYRNHLNVTRDASYRWTPGNPITDRNPRIIDAYGEYIGLDNYMVSSSVITDASQLEDVSYFKFGSLMLGYNFSKESLRKLRISSLGFSFSASNLLIITNYSGIDPETPGAVYPSPRTFSVGMSVGF